MVNIAQIRQWKPEILEEIRNELRRDLDELTTSGDDYAKLELSDADWGGGAAQKAMQAHRELMRQGDHRAAGLAACIKGIEQACDAITPLKPQIDEAEAHGQKYGFQIGENGEISDTLEGKPLPPDMNPEDRKRAHDEIKAKLDQVVLTATDIGHDLTVVFNQAGGGGYGTGQETSLSAASTDGTNSQTLTTPPPPQGNNPAQNAAWWATLTKAERDEVVRVDPDQIGNRDGIPGSARSAANISRISGMRARLKKELSELEKDDSSIGEYDLQVTGDREEEVKAKLNGLDRIEALLGQPGGRQLLTLDDSSPRLEAALGVGDVDKAKNVAVFTPGLKSKVDSKGFSDYDTDMQNIKNAADGIAHRDDTAAVTWLGYQAPQLTAKSLSNPLDSVAGPAPAMSGGEKLADFYNGLGASRDNAPPGTPPMHLTALGHSYGSTTTGYALGHDTPVNDSVLFGSPGQGAMDLKVPDGHKFSEWNSGDWIPHANHGGTLGPSPYDDPSTSQLSTDASGQFHGTSGHGTYLQDQSASQHNMASIVAGRPELAKTK